MDFPQFFLNLPLNSRLTVERKVFERTYSVEIPKLKKGENFLDFEISRSFFEHFEYSPVKDGEIKVQGLITKYNTHLDCVFDFDGYIMLECDRCLEPYTHHFKSQRRVNYTFGTPDENQSEEVVVIDKDEPILDLSGDFYEWINLEAPLRRIPDPKVHTCSEEVLNILGIRPGEELIEEEE